MGFELESAGDGVRPVTSSSEDFDVASSGGSNDSFIISNPHDVNDYDVVAIECLIDKVLSAVTSKFCDVSQGGCLHIHIQEENIFIDKSLMVGPLHQDYVEECQAEARQEIDRLLKHPEHILSSQSASPPDGEFGGAVRFPSKGHVIAFVGTFAPNLAEAMVASVGYWLSWFTPDEFVALCEEGDNKEIFLEVQGFIFDQFDKVVEGEE